MHAHAATCARRAGSMVLRKTDLIMSLVADWKAYTARLPLVERHTPTW